LNGFIVLIEKTFITGSTPYDQAFFFLIGFRFFRIEAMSSCLEMLRMAAE
jgi:hypothetical protein